MQMIHMNYQTFCLKNENEYFKISSAPVVIGAFTVKSQHSEAEVKFTVFLVTCYDD